MSSFETFVNTELPRRPTMLLPALAGGYDGDPNLPGAPSILQNSPTGTYYLQSSGLLWIKNSSTPGTWASVGSGGGPAALDVTTEPLTLSIDSVLGVDPVGVRYQTQAQVAAHGLFKTISGAIDAVPSDLRYGATLELADGIHVLGKDGLGKLGRFVSEITEYSYINWWPPDVWGFLKIKSKNGLMRVAGTSEMTVSTVTNLGYGTADVVMTADPTLADDTYRNYFMRIVSGGNVGKLTPIFHHSGDTFNIADLSNTAAPGDTVEIVAAAAQIDIQASNIGYIIQHGSAFPCILDAVDVINTLPDYSDLEWASGQLWAIGGTRFLVDGGLYLVGGLWRLGDVIVKGYANVRGKMAIVTETFFGSTFSAFFSGLVCYGGIDEWLSHEAGWLLYCGKPLYISNPGGAGIALQGPGYMPTGNIYTPEASVGAQISGGAWLGNILYNAHGTTADVYFDGTPFVLWGSLVTPAVGAEGSRIG